MNRYVLPTASFFIASLLFLLTGCSKESTQETPATVNGFAFNDSTYQTVKGYICGPLASGGFLQGFCFALVSDSVECTWDSATQGFLPTGKGDVVTFKIWSILADRPSPGKYLCRKSSAAPDPFQFDGEFAAIAYNWSTQQGTLFPTTGGTITIDECGAFYYITYSLKSPDGSRVKGAYNGKLELIDPWEEDE
jgi:hypothetical protein